MSLRPIALLLVVAACGRAHAPPEPVVTPSADPPPATRADATVLPLHGVDVPDPYAWLEDLDSPEVAAWVAAQEAHARRALDALPGREALRDRLTALWTYARSGLPVVAGPHTFSSYNDGTQDQAVLRVQTGDGAPRVLIDPNTWSTDGTVALGGWEPTDDGRLLAYARADAGSDWRTWRIRDVATGADLDDELRWVKFSGVSWLPDGSAFVYSRFPAPAEASGDATFAALGDMRVYLHRVGTPQADDVLVYADPDHPKWFQSAGFTRDGAHLVLYTQEEGSDDERVRAYDVDAMLASVRDGRVQLAPRPIFDANDARYSVVGTDGSRAYVWTDKDAPRGRVLVVDLSAPERVSELIAQGDDPLRSVVHAGGHLVLTTLHDAFARVAVHRTDGTLAHTVELPGLGSVGGISGRPDQALAYVAYEDFTTPDSVLALDVASGTLTPMFAPTVDADLDRYVTEQVFVPSKDGTQVPVFLVHRRDLDRSRPHPTLLYGYGGFDISITPAFRVSTLAWLELGGVYASANLRGGGEYGNDWHEAGTKLHKQNVFDDFIASAEWLIANGWTTTPQLGVHGRSNGGLLVGAVLTQRPDLFGATVPSGGVRDMLKYHRWTIGYAWARDYGRADASPEMFRYLLGYSPVHNVRPGTAYPPTLITTGDHDDRVVPAHSFKFAAAMQAATPPDAGPVLLRVETRAGHGAGTPISLIVDEQADVLGFLAHHLGAGPLPPR